MMHSDRVAKRLATYSLEARRVITAMARARTMTSNVTYSKALMEAMDLYDAGER